MMSRRTTKRRAGSPEDCPTAKLLLEAQALVQFTSSLRTLDHPLQLAALSCSFRHGASLEALTEQSRKELTLKQSTSCRRSFMPLFLPLIQPP